MTEIKLSEGLNLQIKGKGKESLNSMANKRNYLGGIQGRTQVWGQVDEQKLRMCEVRTEKSTLTGV